MAAIVDTEQVVRISVAALAPEWEVPGHFRGVVGLLNSKHYSGVRSASAFGGAVTVTVEESDALRSLEAVFERQGSYDARLLVPVGKVEGVTTWFMNRGPDRWLADMVREVHEEALCEGEPVFNAAMFDGLAFEYQRVVRTRLGKGSLKSKAASETSTEYLWWIYKIVCSREVLDGMRRSNRVIFPTESQLGCGLSDDIVLSATLTAIDCG